MSDRFKDKCGLFGVYGHPDAMALTVRGLSALQHRGQESAGIAYCGTGDIDCVKVMGTVRDLLPRVQSAVATAAIGHVRYGTCGDSSLENAQPFVSLAVRGRVALCHNGHIVNIDHLKAMLRPGDELKAPNDSELLARRVAMHFTGDIARAIQDAFQDVTPAYSVILLTADSLCAVRDPLGMRPLSVGRKGRAMVVSSETCAFDTIGATYVRDVDPGEIVLAQGDETRSVPCVKPREVAAHCIFELIYFARPDSVVFGQSVAEFRMRLGARLALEAPALGDVVVPVPDSAVYGGLGYAHTSGLELAMALFRNDFVGRSFIEPTPAARTATILSKFNPITSLIKGRRVILVDDSIVRGNTCLHLVRMLREAGAREVHVRVTSPPTIATCHFGVDTPDDWELFANGCDPSEMKRTLNADSLEFLSLAGLSATAAPMKGFCTGCFSGVYPIAVPGRQFAPGVMTLAALNAFDRARFVDLLRDVWEESPWVAERAWEHRPFDSIDHLHAAMTAIVAGATREEQLALLRAHPDLGARGRTSDASSQEQVGVELDRLPPDAILSLGRLNVTYREKFSFPFVLAVKGSTKYQVLEALKQRLLRGIEEEFAEALCQVYRIARFRLERLVG